MIRELVGRRFLVSCLTGIAIALPVYEAWAAWNNPYPAGEGQHNILYTAFTERPKKLDPARSYSANEYVFIANIYEPPFQYHYLKRPYGLEPLTAQEVPEPVYLDSKRRRLPHDAAPERIAYSVYRIQLKDNIAYQPHPCFALDENGNPRYAALNPADLKDINKLDDFTLAGTRKLVASDYVYQIKRLAHPKLHSPIFSIMGEYIVGFRDFGKRLEKAIKNTNAGGPAPDLTQFDMEGLQVVDELTYEITIHGKYPQFIYWMAMPFFAPMPPEADRFFSLPGMKERNITLDWYAVGTGPYMLSLNDPNRKMVLRRNPNYRRDVYPSEGEAGDRDRGLLDDAGKVIPFIDEVVFSLEKESIPYWNKFLQGYYDRSGISAESFDQAIRFTPGGDTELSTEMREKGIRLLTAVGTSSYYFGFNMLDKVVGGYSERARKLRQAISIAMDTEERITIFRNGRGLVGHSPIPPGIFGYREGAPGINSVTHVWRNNDARRRPVEDARRLLAEAGYPDGLDRKTGEPLVLFFETVSSGPEDKAQLDWMRKQFAKLNLQLVIRATDYNRFQDKMSKGDAQMFEWGWNADYPDPENFLFLLYGPNGKVKHHGENAANYNNPEFDRLFVRMKHMENGPRRQAIIDQMVELLRQDAPWVWGFHPKQFSLSHRWVYNVKPNLMANNTLKYLRIDPKQRAAGRNQWNRPVLWPLVLLFLLFLAGIIPAVMMYRQKERGTA